MSTVSNDEPEVITRTTPSPLDTFMRSDAFRLEWGTDLRHQIAHFLLTTRKRLNLTQTQLAKATGLTQPAIARLENGVHNIRIDTLAKLLRGLGVVATFTPLNTEHNP